MNVILTCTPEYSPFKLAEIVKLLQSIPGELNFIEGKPFTQAQFKWANKKFENMNQITSLSFSEFFGIVQYYRENREIDNRKINDNEFVIIISSIKNQFNWFSAFQKKNIFVHGDEWDIFSAVDAKFGIAYQCIENVFQSLIELDIEHVDIEQNIHMEPIGCINDFCGHKPDILRKLQSANICDGCFQRAKDKGVTYFVLSHIISIMEVIRKEFVISKRFLQEATLEKVIIDETGNVRIGERIIKLDIMPKVLYICFLKNLSGIPSKKLCENKRKFEEIYSLIKTNPKDDSIRRMCCDEIKENKTRYRYKPTFETYRGKIKMALKEKLGETLSNLYTVNLVQDLDKQNIFKIPLTLGQFEIHLKFEK